MIRPPRKGVRRVLRPAPYDPDARDADNDGIVQEYTIWERPNGTFITDAAGNLLGRGVSATQRPTGSRVVDKNKNKVPEMPKPGESPTPAGGGLGPSLGPTLAQSGIPTLAGSGLPNIGGISKPASKPVAPETPAVTPFSWRDLAPDGRLYRAQTEDRDYSGDEDDSVIYFSGDRDYTTNFGGNLLQTTGLPANVLDVRDPKDQQLIRKEVVRIAEELDKVGQELEGDARRKYLSAKRDFDARMLAEHNERNLTSAIANLSHMINSVKTPDNPFRPGTGQRAILDALDRDAIIDMESDGGHSIAFRKMPDLLPTKPTFNEPKKPYVVPPPPMSGRAAELADESNGDYGKFLAALDKEGYVVFDYETTGVNEDDKPVQVGAVKVKGGEVVERFNVFMNPGIPLYGWSATELKDPDGNVLTDEYLQNQISVTEAHARLRDFIDGGIVVAYNYPFDQGFLERATKGTGVEITPSGSIDALELARQVIPKSETGSHKLSALSEFLGVKLEKAHTADADAEATGEVLRATLKRAISERVDKQILNSEYQRKLQVEKNAKYAADMEAYLVAKGEYDRQVAQGG